MQDIINFMSLMDLTIKIPEYAKDELDRLIKKYSEQKLKGEFKFDKNSMITLMIMTYDKSNTLLLNPEKIINKIQDELEEFYRK